ncbi:hypothetical protein BS78_K080600 [Paspalum vaginatum]|uniref:DUF4220 domain-containing protein n=1 Tax=Paspalum vaginatum TaxID=158149 RepID=A0A9W7X9N9_9POAL|nr:hypothetical protein BS78_K080600 [Paspalum vaginatum]
MDWAPSPLPQASSDCPGTKDYSTRVEGFVIVSVGGMFLLHVLGSIRRRSSSGLVHNTVKAVDTLSYPLVAYTIGKMDSSYLYYNDFAVWVVFLLLLLGSTECLTACRLSDIDNWKSTYVKHLFKAFMVVWVVLYCGQHIRYLWGVLAAILFVGVIKSYVRITSMRMVSKSNLSKNVKVIVDYIKYKDNPTVSFDPVTMQGYRYLVAGEKHCVSKPSEGMPWYKKEGLKIRTVEEIWRCTGNLLHHAAAAAAKDSREKKNKTRRAQSLKDLCLSMALSKMLSRRFAGLELSEAELDKTHDLVFRGLLLTGGGAVAGHRQPHERAFRVIEEELGFVHDLYYTRYFYLYQKGRYYALCLPIIMFGLCSWLTYLLVKHSTSLFDVTIFITAVLAFLELYQLYLYLASGWFKMLIGLLLRFRAFRPWKNKLGQYCLLSELGHESRFRCFLHHATLGLPRKKGRPSSVELSRELKQAIVASLLGSGDGNLTLTNGVTETILVWHIATTLCQQQLDDQAKDMDMYCMHLLAFAPNLLPDHTSISEPILDQAIHEADKLSVKDHKKLDERCSILKKYTGHEAPLLTKGAKLAEYLMDDVQEPTLRWKVLSDFWAEMMLYVSPSDDARAHLEVLANGGEFITHIWALLTHAGVLKRNGGPAPPQGRPCYLPSACKILRISLYIVMLGQAYV